MARDGQDTQGRAGAGQGAGDTVVPAAVRDLLEERATCQAWIDKLGGLRGKYRPEVAERVEEDYRARLVRLEEDLGSYRADLEGGLAARREAAAELSAERDARAAELEEAELRFAVGEFADEEWNQLREERAGGIAELDGRIEAEGTAIDELESVLAEIAGESTGAARATPEDGAILEGEEIPESRIPEGRSTSEARIPEGRPTSEARSTSDGRARSPGGAASGTVSNAAASGPGAEEGGVRDELEFLESLTFENPDRFDSVARMLDAEENEGEASEGGASEGDAPEGNAKGRRGKRRRS